MINIEKEKDTAVRPWMNVITKDVLDQGVNGFEDNKSSVDCFDGCELVRLKMTTSMLVEMEAASTGYCPVYIL